MLLKLLLGMTGIAVTLLIYQINLTVTMKEVLSSKLSDVRERVAVLEWRIDHLVAGDNSYEIRPSQD